MTSHSFPLKGLSWEVAHPEGIVGKEAAKVRMGPCDQSQRHMLGSVPGSGALPGPSASRLSTPDFVYEPRKEDISSAIAGWDCYRCKVHRGEDCVLFSVF